MNDKSFECDVCHKRFVSPISVYQHAQSKHKPKPKPVREKRAPEVEPDWEHECEVCGQSPVVPLTGLCGPCTWGEAETIGGNW